MPTKNELLEYKLGIGGLPVSYRIRERTWTNTLNYATRTGRETNLPINVYDDLQLRMMQVPGRDTTFSPSGTVNTDAYVGFTDKAGLQSYHNTLNTWGAVGEVSDDRLQNEALVKALGKIADAKTNLAVSLAEAKKTSDLILNRASRIYWFYRDLRRGAFRDAADTLGVRWNGRSTGRKANAADLLLEWSYGWKPLLHEIKGSAEFLAQQVLGGRPPVFSVSATASGLYHKHESVQDPSYSPGSGYFRSYDSSKKLKVKIWCEVTNPHFNALQQVGLTNPLLYAWEVIPFSFVFDWFVSVGDYLTGISSLHGITIRRAMVSREKTSNVKYVSQAVRTVWPGTNQTQKSGYVFSYESRGRRYSRNPLTVDLLKVYPPVDRDPLNLQRLANGLALIRGNARRISNLRG